MPRGRPRQFDPEAVLRKALEVFWEKGYSATSFPDLEAATGLCRPSLYSAFGKKRSLFLKALELYCEETARARRVAFQEASSARQALGDLLRCGARFHQENPAGRGCLVLNGLAETKDPEVQAAIQRAAQECLEEVRACLERGREAGEFPEDLDLEAVATQVAVTQMGMAAWVKAGAPPEKLEALADRFLASLPGAGD